MAYKLLESINGTDPIYEWIRKKGKRKVCIWGMGTLCSELLRRLDEKVNIVGIILSNANIDLYENVRVYSPLQVPKETDLIIVVPGYDIDKIRKKICNENIVIVPIDEMLM